MSGAANQSYAKGITFVLLATLGWSLSGLFVRLMPELSGWQLNTWRGYWTAVSIFIYLILVYGRDTMDVFRRVPLAALAFSAGFFAFGSTMYVTSLTLVSTAVISVIGASSPLFTGVLSPWVTGERPGIAAWIAALMAIGGVGIIANDELEVGNAIGMLVCLLVPLSFAAQTLVLRRYRSIDMIPAIAVGGLLSFVCAGMIGFLFHPGGGYAVELRHVAMLALMGLVQLAIPLIWYAKGAKSVPAITLSLVVMLDAVLNPFWPWLVVGETPEAAAFWGGGVIISAVLISIFGERWMKTAMR
ncbi:MAG: DMT family transporter [Rhizobiales bacterium]|nr:DMT family transporter [Hyphomicrobiales bacterium]